MKIECLKPGTDITIDASDGTKNLSFASSVLEVTENDREYLKQVRPRSFNLSQIPIAVVYEQEYVVNFESKTAVCSVTALIDGRPYIWDRVKIIIINLPDSGNCYMAFSTGNVKPYNRRSEYRLPLMGDAIIGMGGTTKDAIIRDISRSGIGLMCDEGFGLERGMHLEVQFKTKIGWSAQPTLFRLEGTVLRVIPAGKSRVNVGCRLTRADAYDAYDVPVKASDEMELDDSEEVYTYILCSICPVKMSKPGLGYYETEDKVDLRIRDWVVQTPVAGFLYPSFNERSSDVNEALFFSKKPKEIDHCFIDDLMCCESGRSKSEKKVEFDSIVEKVLEEYRDAEEKIYSFHENLNALVDEREATESDEPLTAEEVLDAAQEAGFEEAYAQQISDSYASSFKEDPDTPETFVDKKLLEKNAALKEVTDLKAEVSRLMKENLELKKRLEE